MDPLDPYASLCLASSVYIPNDDAAQPNFVNLDAKYTCLICGKLLREPVQTLCGHMMCRSCVESRLEEVGDAGFPCPAKENDCKLITKDKVNSDFSVMREINLLEVHCTNLLHGCQETMQLRRLKNHIPVCKFRPVICSFQPKECEEISTTPHTIDKHKASCPNPSVTCKYCQRSIKDTDWMFHSQVCKLLPVICSFQPKGCEEISTQDTIDEHKASCPYRTIKCIYCCRSLKAMDWKIHSPVCKLRPVICSFQPKGCEEISTPDTIDKHKTSCPYRTVKCIYCCRSLKAMDWKIHIPVCKLRPVICSFQPKGCEEISTPHTIDKHKASCPYPSVTCEYCHRSIKDMDLMKHVESECPDLITDCPYKCGATGIHRLNLDDHLQSCPSCCKFHAMGCRKQGTAEELAEHERNSLSEHLDLVLLQLAKLQLESTRLRNSHERLTKDLAPIRIQYAKQMRKNETLQKKIDTLTKDLKDQQQSMQKRQFENDHNPVRQINGTATGEHKDRELTETAAAVSGQQQIPLASAVATTAVNASQLLPLSMLNYNNHVPPWSMYPERLEEDDKEQYDDKGNHFSRVGKNHCIDLQVEFVRRKAEGQAPVQPQRHYEGQVHDQEQGHVQPQGPYEGQVHSHDQEQAHVQPQGHYEEQVRDQEQAHVQPQSPYEGQVHSHDQEQAHVQPQGHYEEQVHDQEQAHVQPQGPYEGQVHSHDQEQAHVQPQGHYEEQVHDQEQAHVQPQGHYEEQVHCQNQEKAQDQPQGHYERQIHGHDQEQAHIQPQGDYEGQTGSRSRSVTGSHSASGSL